MKKETNLTKVIVPCRLSYLHVFAPNAINGGEPKYSVCAIIPKSDKKTVDAVKKAIEVAKKEAVLKFGGNISAYKTPLRDGDEERMDDDTYKGCYFINANTKIPPQVVDKNVKPILDESEVYSGCYGRISVTFYGYHVDENLGIAGGLGNIQKLRDGEVLYTRALAIDEFDVVE